MEKNKQRKSLANKFIAILIVFCILFAHCAVAGTNLVMAVSDALENQTTMQKGENVEFDAYFGDNGIQHSKEINVANSETLYLKVQVKDKVSVPKATIKIEDPNFSIDKDKFTSNRYVKNINADTNEIELTNISSNSTALIEVPIKFKKAEKLDSSYFDKEVEIKLIGSYKNTKQKEKELEGSVKVKPIWKSTPEVTTTQKISNYFSLGENGTLIEQEIKTELKNNLVPRKKEEVQTQVPEINGKKPQEVKVLIDGELVDKSKINYNKDEGIVVVTYNNDDKNISWTEDDSEKVYTLVYKFNEQTAVAETALSLKTRSVTTSYTANENNVKMDDQELNVTPIGNMVTVGTKLSGTVYKGFMNENEDKNVSYTEKDTIKVSYAEGIDNVKLDTNDNVYVDEVKNVLFQADNLIYKSSTIKKDELVNLLGENGKLTIKDESGNVISEVTKDSETKDENTIVVNYDNGVKKLTFETTKPEKEGELTITNSKVVNGVTNQKREVINNVKELVVTPVVTTNLTKEKTSASLKMNETKTEATVEINKTSLSTAQEKENVDITITLMSNNQKHDLYKNPKVFLEFPEDISVTKINTINTLYDDQLKVVAQSHSVKDGKAVVGLQLEGEQTEHKGSGVKGTVISMNADLTLKKKATTKDSSIVMRYTNEKATRYNNNAEEGIAEAKIQIVSPKAMITTNNIPELGIKTYGEEEGATKRIKEKSNQQLLTMESEIVNNNPTDIKDVKILGTIGTQGKVGEGKDSYENTIAAVLSSQITVENIDMNKVSIYYTENAQATDDIQDVNNRWQPTVGNAGAVKKYLIKISDMAKGEGIKAYYKMTIPENLDYGKEMRQGYTVKYSDNQIAGENEVKATTVKLETAPAPKVKVALSGEIGNQPINDKTQVKKKEIIKYNVEITNEGDEDAENVKVEFNTPEGTKLVNKENAKYTIVDDKSAQIEVGTVKAKETKVVNVYLTPADEAPAGTQIKASAKVTFGGYELTTNELTALVSEEVQEVVAVIGHDDNETIEYKQGSTFKTNMMIQNMTNNEMKDVEVKWNLPKELELVNSSLYADFEAQNKSSITIPSLKAGEIATVTGTFKVKENVSTDVTIAGEIKCNGVTYQPTSTIAKLKESKDYELKMTSETSNKYVNPEDIVNYHIEVKNNNDFVTQGLRLKSNIPSQFKVVSAEITSSNNAEKEQLQVNGNKIDTSITMDRGETKTLTIIAKVNQQENLTQDIEVKADVSLEENGKAIGDKKEIKNKMKSTVTNGSAKVAVAGIAWRDVNANASKDDFENTIPNTRVRLLDIETNEFVKDENGKEIESYTDDTGAYKFENISTGDYIVVFDYDATQYKVTDYEKEGADESESSKAISRKLDVGGEEKTYAVTDIVSVDEDSQETNINLGLEQTEKFDLELKKYVSKVTVNNQDGIKTYNYDKESLAKIELDSKKMNGATVVIEYNIEVSNTGEAAGYAKTIEDAMPTDLTFASEMNKDWYQSGSVVRTNILENQEIQPGETKTLKLVLTKTMTDNNTGIITNSAEIVDSYNEDGTVDIDSTPGNGEQAEDDFGTADTIISVKTGAATVYTTLILIILAMIGIGVFFIRKETVEVNEDIFKGL